jgi:hypothetical protein
MLEIQSYYNRLAPRRVCEYFYLHFVTNITFLLTVSKFCCASQTNCSNYCCHSYFHVGSFWEVTLVNVNYNYRFH